MAPPRRPGGLELRSQSFDPPSNASLGSIASASMSSLSLADIPSPQAGEVPPALSPLDALALQGRLLAKRFEQADKSGRRLSRLAPLTIQNEFGHRPGYFTSLSSALTSPNDDLGLPTGHSAPASPGHKPQPSPRQFHGPERHRSVLAQFGGEEPQNVQTAHMRLPLASIGETSPAVSPQGYFDIPRTHSPEAVEHHIGVREATPVSPSMSDPASRMFLNPQRKPSSDSQPRSPRSHPQANLLPPRSSNSLHSQRSPRLSPSIRSVQDSSDDVEDMSLSASYDSLQQNRSLSPSFRPHSPFMQATHTPLARSASQSSEYSVGGSCLSRPAFNFSRPMSRQSQRPSVDMKSSVGPPSRQQSDESVHMRPSFDANARRQDYMDSPTANYHSETVHTPVSMVSEDCFRRSSDFSTNPASSYTYTKFDLPRGRKLDRSSVGAETFVNDQIKWDQPNQNQSRPPSPESPPRSFESERPQQQSTPVHDNKPDHGAPSLTSSNSTIRARPATAGAEITPQEHCDKGIELHEAGELLKSTYHLRLAARAGLPEAMFWYGLACRHGWGMRENKAEALTWFRRAVDSGHLEVADDEDQSKNGQPIDIVKKKQHRARYGVAIYELGKCYMNGWGAAQDKSLALRCYEIAGNWGDADALVEAGYCYAEGVGCRKDMKKAAKFYRAAEAKGVSMVGNSWIYKDKYNDNSAASDARSVRSGRSLKKDNSEKKPRDKSRTRALFTRKKSAASPVPS